VENGRLFLSRDRAGVLPHTGDPATVDADGVVYIVGRGKDFLKCRGGRIACQQIEARRTRASSVG
jgi:acyl-CoA synthetase (AMP-forming)/AMP-acid ligase II